MIRERQVKTIVRYYYTYQDGDYQKKKKDKR